MKACKSLASVCITKFNNDDDEALRYLDESRNEMKKINSKAMAVITSITVIIDHSST